MRRARFFNTFRPDIDLLLIKRARHWQSIFLFNKLLSVPLHQKTISRQHKAIGPEFRHGQMARYLFSESWPLLDHLGP